MRSAMSTRRALAVAGIAAIGLLGVGVSVAGAATTADGLQTPSADGPCWAELVADPQGAVSKCPPNTWQHSHRIHVTCQRPGHAHEVIGPWAGGTTESAAYCGPGYYANGPWVEQGPECRMAAAADCATARRGS